MRGKKIIIFSSVFIAAAGAAFAAFAYLKPEQVEPPDQLLQRYMDCIEKQEYENMYAMLSEESKSQFSQEYFIERNKKIYEGIEASDIKTAIKGAEENSSHGMIVDYQQTLNSSGGEIQFENQAVFTREDKSEYTLVWEDSMIFPQLMKEYKVNVSTMEAKRGEILDRNGRQLAGPGTASEVGLVPGKMNVQALADLAKLEKILGLSDGDVQKKLDAVWVKEDSFVPIATLEKLIDDKLMSEDPDEETLKKKAMQEKLLKIPGVMISDVEVRYYPLGESASHLTGYVQSVKAEDLEEHQGEGYGPGSVIGRSGMEGLYEKELKGKDGHKISIIDEQGITMAILAVTPMEDGRNIALTIDADLQKSLYEEFKEDKSCSVAMNPYTGEVLALVSTPSFDSNAFIRGLSDKQWADLNNDERKPLYNRFRQVVCPGSSLKPVVAGLGLGLGKIDPNEDYGNSGLKWQKDTSWGDYYVTTLHAYDSAVLENALIYSDNIYFAKTALKIGAEQLQNALDKLGFNQKLPFEISMTESQYSNTDEIGSEIQLADSGYGQGEILINPLHLASLYTAFNNSGNVVKPYLRFKGEAVPEIWLHQAFSKEIADYIKGALEKVVSNPEGTGHGVEMQNMKLAGKTGTAEIKMSQEDTTGTELGWFGVFTVEPDVSKPVLMISMVEDVKDRGGSSYVVNKSKVVLDSYFANE